MNLWLTISDLCQYLQFLWCPILSDKNISQYVTLYYSYTDSSDTTSGSKTSNLLKYSENPPGIGTRFDIMCIDNYLDSFDKNVRTLFLWILSRIFLQKSYLPIYAMYNM